MDADRLAEYMSAATGLNISDCLSAAKTAYKLWYGMLVRCNTSNDGLIPKGGSNCESPDVLLNGLTQLPPYDMITKWNQTTWGPAPRLKNYTYGRAQNKNLQVPIKKGEVKIYYTSNGFNQPPSSWTQLYTYDGTKQTSDLVNINEKKRIQPGERSACDTAFGFEPLGSGHYCLIVCAQTEFFANNPASLQAHWNNTSSAHWITYNGAAGWHNVNVSETGVEALKFYNSDDRPSEFRFVGRCRNLPDGATVDLSCADLGLTESLQVSEQDLEITADVEVPANFDGTLDVKFPILPDNASISWHLLWRVDKKHPAHGDVQGLIKDGIATHNDGAAWVPLGDTHFVGSMD